jgi:hypothetical protein
MNGKNIKILCTTRHGNKQSCDVSLKKKNKAEYQESMHNRAKWQTSLWSFTEIPKVVLVMKRGQAYFIENDHEGAITVQNKSCQWKGTYAPERKLWHKITLEM